MDAIGIKSMKFKKLNIKSLLFRSKQITSDNVDADTYPTYSKCNELWMHNWIQLTETGDLLWLLEGYKGRSRKAFPIELGYELQKIRQDLIYEYDGLTKNGETSNYYELIEDIDNAESRIKHVSMLLLQIKNRYDLVGDSLKAYTNELRSSPWNMRFDDSRPKKEQLTKANRQIGAIKMKLSQNRKRKEAIEDKFKQSKVDIYQVKAKVQIQTRMPFDFKINTVTDWLYALEELSDKKAVA